MKLQKSYLVASCLLLVFTVPLFAQTAYFRTSTNTARWVDSGAKAGTAWAAPANYFTVDTATKYQTIQGFGGCFCEFGWDDIQSLTSTQARDSVIRALFDTSGCNYTFCRVPIGANDFADGYYSCNDVSNDNSMTNFSLHRDSMRIIPFIKAAQAYKPGLRFWASPWTPPSWMKLNNNYYTNTTAAQNHIKTDATTMTAYALYLSKWVTAFRNSGINVEMITCQNEPDQDNHDYPTCGWTNNEEITFYSTYLIPRLNTDNPNTKLILGVYCCGDEATWVTPYWNNATVAAKIGAASHSWQTSSWGANNWNQHQSTPFFETEANWGQGAQHGWNDEGVTQWNSRIDFLTTGKAAVFEAWNMILDERYSSNWNFAQSAPININRTTHIITYEPHYWADKHISHFVLPGAKAVNITTTGTGPAGPRAAFKNPNGDIIVVASNSNTAGNAAAYAATIKVGNVMYKATLPANSFNTIRIAPTVAVQQHMQLQNSAMPALSNVSIRNSTLYFSLSAAVNAREADLTLTDLEGRTVWTGRRAGSELQQAGQVFAIRSERGNLRSGTYLLAARIKNGSGAVTTAKMKVSTVN